MSQNFKFLCRKSLFHDACSWFMYTAKYEAWDIFFYWTILPKSYDSIACSLYFFRYSVVVKNNCGDNCVINTLLGNTYNANNGIFRDNLWNTIVVDTCGPFY